MRIETIFKDRYNEPIQWRGRDGVLTFRTEEEMYRFIDFNGNELLAAGTKEVWISVDEGDFTIYRLERMK